MPSQRTQRPPTSQPKNAEGKQYSFNATNTLQTVASAPPERLCLELLDDSIVDKDVEATSTSGPAASIPHHQQSPCSDQVQCDSTQPALGTSTGGVTKYQDPVGPFQRPDGKGDVEMVAPRRAGELAVHKRKVDEVRTWLQHVLKGDNRQVSQLLTPVIRVVSLTCEACAGPLWPAWQWEDCVP
jgi:hypothetical protein